MKNKKKQLGLIIGTILLTLILFTITRDGIVAADDMLPDTYVFVYDGRDYADGDAIEIKDTSTRDIRIRGFKDGSSAGWETQVKDIKWEFSGADVILDVQNSDNPNFDPLTTRMITAKSPGYSTIVATVFYELNNGQIIRLTVQAKIKVDLSIDYEKTSEMLQASSNNVSVEKIKIGTSPEENVLLFDYNTDGTYSPILMYLKAFGKATNDELSSLVWKSELQNSWDVVTVNKGEISVAGAGATDVTVSTNTIAGETAMTEKIKAVVVPRFSLKYNDFTEGTVIEHSKKVLNNDEVENILPIKVTSDKFLIESNAKSAKNLTWEIIDQSTGMQANKSLVSYEINEYNGNLIVNEIKAGKYLILAHAEKKYSVTGKIPYAALKIDVPVIIKSDDILMNVGDVYNLFEETNLPGENIVNIIIDNRNILDDNGKGEITAIKSGKTKITLTIPNNKNYEFYNGQGQPFTKTKVINVNVIDGISLNVTKTQMFLGSTLRLVANVTDLDYDITWSSSDTSKLTVDQHGLVTARGIGDNIVITATVKINGVIKRARAIIDVIPSVTKIEITPANLNMKLNQEETLHAKITPSNIKNLELIWRTSDDKIVDFVTSEGTSARIVAKSSGTAVITAVNKDNVVMGYAYITVAQPVTSISLSDTNLVLKPGVKHQLFATIKPDNATNKEVLWRTSDDTVASVDQNGLVTARRTGRVAITAVSAENDKIRAICEININIPVTGIRVTNKNIYLNVGGSDKILYQVLPADANNKAVSFVSTNPSIVSVDSSGNIRALRQGMSVILVRTQEGGYLEYASVFVTQQATDMHIDTKDLHLEVGQTHDVKVTYLPANSLPMRVYWTSTNIKVATVAENGEHGKITAKEAGTTTIIARGDNGKVLYFNVHVTKPVEDLSIAPTQTELFVTETLRFTATIKPADATNQDLIWSSSNPSVASVNKNGLVKGLKAGSTIITVSTTDGKHKAVAMVVVKKLATKIKLNHTSYKLALNKSITLKATVDSSVSNNSVKWKSSNTKVATVNQNGKVTAKSLGNAVITVTAQDGSNVSATCNISVIRKATSITIDKTFITLVVGKSSNLKFTIKPSNTTYKTVNWVSSNDEIASVNVNGKVTGLSPGRAVITAKTKDNSGKFAVTTVEVIEYRPATSVTVSNKKLTMVKGEKTSIKAVMYPINTSDESTWFSDNTSVASVNKKTGLITAKATGTAYITVITDSGVTADVEVNVLGLNRTTMQLFQYQTDYLSVEGYRGSINWYSENPNIATVANGKVISRAPGKTNIVAVVNGKKLVCKITVKKG